MTCLAVELEQLAHQLTRAHAKAHNYGDVHLNERTVAHTIQLLHQAAQQLGTPDDAT